MEKHGFARHSQFLPVSQTPQEMAFILRQNEDTLRCYPFPFTLTVSYRLLDVGLQIRYDVENTGERDGDEVIQLYVTDTVASMVRPALELCGFARVFIRRGETARVAFELEASQLSFLDADMSWRVEAGEFELRAGGASDRLEQTAAFRVTDTCIIDGKRRAFYAKVL